MLNLQHPAVSYSFDLSNPENPRLILSTHTNHGLAIIPALLDDPELMHDVLNENDPFAVITFCRLVDGINERYRNEFKSNPETIMPPAYNFQAPQTLGAAIRRADGGASFQFEFSLGQHELSPEGQPILKDGETASFTPEYLHHIMFELGDELTNLELKKERDPMEFEPELNKLTHVYQNYLYILRLLDDMKKLKDAKFEKFEPVRNLTALALLKSSLTETLKSEITPEFFSLKLIKQKMTAYSDLARLFDLSDHENEEAFKLLFDSINSILVTNLRGSIPLLGREHLLILKTMLEKKLAVIPYDDHANMVFAIDNYSAVMRILILKTMLEKKLAVSRYNDHANMLFAIDNYSAVILTRDENQEQQGMKEELFLASVPNKTIFRVTNYFAGNNDLYKTLTAYNTVSYLIAKSENPGDPLKNVFGEHLCSLIKDADFSQKLAAVELQPFQLQQLIKILENVYAELTAKIDPKQKAPDERDKEESLGEHDNDLLGYNNNLLEHAASLRRLQSNYLFVIKKIEALKNPQPVAGQAAPPEAAALDISYNAELLAGINDHLTGTLNRPQACLTELLETIDTLQQVKHLQAQQGQGETFAWYPNFKPISHALLEINRMLASTDVGNRNALEVLEAEERTPAHENQIIDFADITELYRGRSKVINLQDVNKFLIRLNKSAAALSHLNSNNLYRNILSVLNGLIRGHLNNLIMQLFSIVGSALTAQDNELRKLLSLPAIQEWIKLSHDNPQNTVKYLAELVNNLIHDDEHKDAKYKIGLLTQLFADEEAVATDLKHLQAALNFVHLQPKQIIVKQLQEVLDSIKFIESNNDPNKAEDENNIYVYMKRATLGNLNTFVLMQYLREAIAREEAAMKSPSYDSLFKLLGLIEYLFAKEFLPKSEGAAATKIEFHEEVSTRLSDALTQLRKDSLIAGSLVSDKQKSALDTVEFDFTLVESFRFSKWNGVTLQKKNSKFLLPEKDTLKELMQAMEDPDAVLAKKIPKK